MKSNILVFIGTYTQPIKFGTGQILEGKGEGIYLFNLSLETGALTHMHTVTDAVNPSYLVLNKKNQCLYVVNELKEYNGKASGAVSSYSFSVADQTLQYINSQPTNSTDPCHVETSKDDAYIYVSNFMSGSISVFPLGTNGELKPMKQFIQHHGSSVNPVRQNGPHAHSVVFSPDHRYVFVPDLGLDKLMIYKINDNLLDEPKAAYYETFPGAGPRHCTFSPDGRYCYLINELNSSIEVLAYDQASAGLISLQIVSSLPEDVDGTDNTCADIHLTPDGKFLYGSNRGHNSLIIYQIDQNSGLLSYIDCTPCGGEIPRNFDIDPTGHYLLCANQDSDNITIFEIDPDIGLLKQTSKVTINTPVCVKAYFA